MTQINTSFIVSSSQDLGIHIAFQLDKLEVNAREPFVFALDDRQNK